MSHRLACERSDKIAAIAPVAGGNQFAATANCVSSRGVSVLQIHGTADPVWLYNGGRSTSPVVAEDTGIFVAIPDTVKEWALRNKCGPTASRSSDAIAQEMSDGTSVSKEIFTQCRDNTEVVHIKIVNGGHTWPDGQQHASESRAGKVSRAFNTNEVIWEFFKGHPKQ